MTNVKPELYLVEILSNLMLIFLMSAMASYNSWGQITIPDVYILLLQSFLW